VSYVIFYVISGFSQGGRNARAIAFFQLAAPQAIIRIESISFTHVL
jgi:hypothetical protein